MLLDTTVLIDVLRGKAAAGRVRDLCRMGQVPWICPINVEEVVRGARPHEEEGIARFLGGMRLAPIGMAEAELAGRWRREFAGRGTTLSQGDCLIAAAAVGRGIPLATGNPKHFPMNELDLRHWPVGE